MPWKETDVMDQKTEFVQRVLGGVESFGAICRDYGISRKTGYKWWARFFERGTEGLRERSRRPHASPTQTTEDLVCRIVKLKLAHPGWGPKKIRQVLRRSASELPLPSESTFKRVLGKAGLVARRRCRRPSEQGGRVENRIVAERANQVWTIDFKGWWYTRDRSRFEPLTVRDAFSRYILCAQSIADARTETVRARLERVFDAYGLPEVIRSDNGAPFAASRSPLGLSRLSAWWLTLGIDLDRIKPGSPQENGGHERMHRDMAYELERVAAADLPSQQASLDVWRETFNTERPHEALGMQVPADVYCRSERRYTSQPLRLLYPAGYLVRTVCAKGNVVLRGIRVCVSHALSGNAVGLESLPGNRFAVWFCRLCLGEIDLETARFHAARGD